jgi:hypothetical protein
MDQKNKKKHKVFMAFTHTKKVYTESFIKARIRTSGSDQKDPDPTGSATLRQKRDFWSCQRNCSQLGRSVTKSVRH